MAVADERARTRYSTGGGLRIDSLDIAGERHGIYDKVVDLAVAEAGDVAQFRRAMEDFDGKRVVRVGRFSPEHQSHG